MFSIFAISTFVSADTIRIGLRAHHGVNKSMNQWKATADYLSEKIPEHEFIMVPLVGLTELMLEAEQNQFDFVLTNPSSYVEMELRFGASAILTLRNKRQGNPYTQFGSVIFTRKDNNEINNIKDLKDKRIVAVSERAFGGWRVAVAEILNEELDIYKEAEQISFSGGIQQDVVNIVNLGNADAGVVRTDMLERMDKEGLIKLDDFKIINKKSTKGFPFLHSTSLYPEWPLIKMRDTSEVLSKKVILALLTMHSEHPAAIAGKYVGWTSREDYQPVHNLMQKLKVGPYSNYYDNLLEYFIEKYLYQIIFSLILLSGLLFLSLYILKINRQLIQTKTEQDKLLLELEERVALRTKDIMISKELAESANLAKTDFLSRMSHELRTPLNAVLGFAQIIEVEEEEGKTTHLKENVGEILHAGRHLLELVNEVLDLSKIESGKYEVAMKPVFINHLVSKVVRLLKTLAKDKNVTLSFDFDVNDKLTVYADYRALKQVLINIITNAIKYNHPDGSVDVNIIKQTDGYCRIDVVDTGEGIDEEFLEVIFDPFQRITTRTNIEGSGVGLAITKNLVKLMRGKVLVESTIGLGSTFSVLLASDKLSSDK